MKYHKSLWISVAILVLSAVMIKPSAAGVVVIIIIAILLCLLRWACFIEDNRL